MFLHFLGQDSLGNDVATQDARRAAGVLTTRLLLLPVLNSSKKGGVGLVGFDLYAGGVLTHRVRDVTLLLLRALQEGVGNAMLLHASDVVAAGSRNAGSRLSMMRYVIKPRLIGPLLKLL